jgi:subtilisin-like proprotein convertase family protein
MGCELAQELTCNDGKDNDGDLLVDCLDSDCDGINACEFASEQSCMDNIDNDNNGKTDCADPKCAGKDGCQSIETSCGDNIDNDADGSTDCDDSDCEGSGACQLATCPLGSEQVIGSTQDLPVLVPDEMTTTSELTIATAGRVVQAAAVVTVEHEAADELILGLIAPNGNRTNLSTNNGSGDDYVGTVFSDLGPTSIVDADPPFVDTYRPEQSFSHLLGSASAGTWTLELTDDSFDDSGVLTEFSVVLCACVEPCLPEVDCSNTQDDDGDGAADCLDPGCDGVGGCEYQIESSCADGIDNDGDGASDCEDSDCTDGGQCLIACPPGSLASTYVATDTPISIPDESGTLSSVAGPLSGRLVSAAVEVSISHAYMGDLILTLSTPNGTLVSLAEELGGGGLGYVQTIFSDTAATSINAGAPPFTGLFQPNEPLSDVNGALTPGNWTLLVVDDGEDDIGIITDYRLHLCVEQ